MMEEADHQNGSLFGSGVGRGELHVNQLVDRGVQVLNESVGADRLGTLDGHAHRRYAERLGLLRQFPGQGGVCTQRTGRLRQLGTLQTAEHQMKTGSNHHFPGE